MKDKQDTTDSTELQTHENNPQIPTVAKWAKIQQEYADPDVTQKGAREKVVRQIHDEYDTLVHRQSETLYRYDEDDGIYRDDAERVLRERLNRCLEKHFTRNEQNEIFHRLNSTESIPADEFRGPDEMLCVDNGVLDTGTPEEPTLENHSPDLHFQRRIPVQYDPDADCPRFKQFLDEVVYDDDRAKLQEFVGYCLHYWGMPFNRALMLTGPTHSGKSTFLNVVAALLGENNVARQSLQDLANRFGPAELYGKYANIRADLDTDTVENIGLFKELAAGDRIRAERKYEHPFRFQVTQKQLYAANEVPDLAHEDDAFHERWIHVQFPETVPDDDRDEHLDNRLTTDDELAGVLNWALEGYARLMQRGRFTGERSIDGKKDIWRSQGDSIDQFVNAVLEVDPDAETPKSDVYDAYREFCDDIDRQPEAKQSLTKRLQQKHNVHQTRPTIDGRRVRSYAGVAIAGESSEPNFDLEVEEIALGEGL